MRFILAQRLLVVMLNLSREHHILPMRNFDLLSPWGLCPNYILISLVEEPPPDIPSPLTERGEGAVPHYFA
jgi:hypothetical protein